MSKEYFNNMPIVKLLKFFGMKLPIFLIGFAMEMAVIPAYKIFRLIWRLPAWLFGVWWCYSCNKISTAPKEDANHLTDWEGDAVWKRHFRCCDGCYHKYGGHFREAYVKKAFWRKYFINWS